MLWRRACMVGLGGVWAVGALLIAQAFGLIPLDPPLLVVGGLLLLVCGAIAFGPEIRSV